MGQLACGARKNVKNNQKSRKQLKPSKSLTMSQKFKHAGLHVTNYVMFSGCLTRLTVSI